MATRFGNLEFGAPRNDQSAPPFWLFLREFDFPVRVAKGINGYPDIAARHKAKCDKRPILLLPGFLASRGSMRALQKTLRGAGYRTHHWGQGRNMGAHQHVFDQLEKRIADLHTRYEQPITLIGWSLGGLMARELAKKLPDMVQEVISMGSPFSGAPRANNVWRLYEWVSGYPVDEPPFELAMNEKPPVPTTAFWSYSDGMIAPACARGQTNERDTAIEVHCTHMGFVSDPDTIDALLGHLALSSQRT